VVVVGVIVVVVVVGPPVVVVVVGPPVAVVVVGGNPHVTQVVDFSMNTASNVAP
jgi:hypothetical protein